MAEVNDIFDKITDEQSFFDPSKEKKVDTKKFEPIREGEYLGHITDVETKILDVKRDGNFKARMYKYTITISPENTLKMFTRTDINGKPEALYGGF